jgi:arylsulfatase A-like enzyme
MKGSSLCLLFLIVCLSSTGFAQYLERPNVILIITDDQGYGDLGVTGNPFIKTPTLDQLAGESIRFNNFYVSPVCAPTRASLMTGRYSLRTGVRDTYNGGAIMSPNETTIAEMLQAGGYQTGAFGKWHLGDNYPSRPMDQGFDESVIHLSGGMGQVGDFTTYFKKDSSYFDPVLWHNGEQEAYDGYCSDIFTDQAIKFIDAHREEPFFCYIAFNAPHTPLQVPDEYYQMYQDIDPSRGLNGAGLPVPEMSERDKEAARKVYAMVTNIDDNIKKILDHLYKLQIADNTIVIFMTDNGPQQRRYIAGMRGRKGSVYRGGVRVPFYLRYPALAKNMEIDVSTAHIDVLPTLAQLCGADLPEYTQLDGKSLVPLLQDPEVEWPERSLFFYWTRRYPELYHNIALQRGPYKLVGQSSYDATISEFGLFNLEADPAEQHNLIREQTLIGQALKNELDDTFQELVLSPNLLNPPLIEIGHPTENPTVLNRNDADGERGIWAQEEIFGKWNVKINPGYYDIRFKFIQPLEAEGALLLETGSITHRKENATIGTDILEMKKVYLPALEGELIPHYSTEGKRIFPFWVELTKIE